MKNKLFALLVPLTLFNTSVKALEAEVGFNEVLSKEEVIEINDKDKYLDWLENMVDEYNNKQDNLSYRYRYLITKHENLEEDKDSFTTENIIVDGLFDSYDEALKYYDSIKLDEPSYKENMNIVSKEIKETVEKSTSIVKAVCVNDCSDEINNIEVKDGYQLVTDIKEIKESTTISKTFDTLKEAESYLEDLKNKNEGAGTISKVINSDENKVEETTGDVQYLKEEEALKKAKDLEVKDDTKEVSATVRKEVIKKESDKLNIADYVNEEFDSYDEAIAKIKSLEDEGYIVDATITQETYNESSNSDENNNDNDSSTTTNQTFSHLDITLLDKAIIIDEDGKKQEVDVDMKISSVTVNDKKLSMDGPSKDPNTGLLEYESKSRSLSIKNNDNITVKGTITFTLNGEEKTLDYQAIGTLDDGQNVCGGKDNSKGFDLKFETITIADNNVYVDANIITKYKITGTMYKMIDTDVWYVDTKTTYYGFDYLLDASYIEKKKELNYYFNYNEVNTITKYQLSYDIKTYELKQYADIKWIIESIPKEEEVITNIDDGTTTVSVPKTGIKEFSKNGIVLISILISGVIFKRKLS